MNKFQKALSESVDRTDKENYKNLKDLCDRATPKKPIMKPTQGIDAEAASVLSCPTCGNSIVNVWNRADYKPNYCHYCGQALDWSDEE